MNISITYSSLNAAADNLEKSARRCADYASSLNSRVSRKLDSLTMGATTHTSNASYFVSRKRGQLDSRAMELNNLAKKVRKVGETAREKDRAVADTIKKEGKDFRKTHNLTCGVFDGFMEVLTRFANGVMNASAFGRWVRERIRDFTDCLSAVRDAFRAWYHCGGGKYWIKLGLAVAGAIVAVVALIAAVAVGWPALLAILGGAVTLTNIAAVCSMVMAAIAVVDSIVAICEGGAAVMAFQSDPGWAARYSSITTFSDFLHRTNFSSKIGNILSEAGACIVDTVTAICAVVTVVNSVRNVVEFFRNGYRSNANWKRHFKTGKNGQFSLRETLKNWKYNMKGVDYAFKDKHLIQKEGALKRTSEFYKSFKEFSKKFEVFKKTYKSLSKMNTNYDSRPKPDISKTVSEKIKKKLRLNEVENAYKKIKKVTQTDYDKRKSYGSPQYSPAGT